MHSPIRSAPRWHVAYGAANALIFPNVLAFNTPAVPEKTKAVMEALGYDTSDTVTSVFDAAYAFCAELGIETRFSGLGVPENDLDAMADDAFAIRRLATVASRGRHRSDR